MRKIKQTERPYLIRYIKGQRHLMDSAATLEAAKARVAERGKRVRGERGEIWCRGELVHTEMSNGI